MRDGTTPLLEMYLLHCIVRNSIRHSTSFMTHADILRAGRQGMVKPTTTPQVVDEEMDMSD